MQSFRYPPVSVVFFSAFFRLAVVHEKDKSQWRVAADIRCEDTVVLDLL